MKLIKKYDKLFPQTLQSIAHKITNIIKNKVKYISTRVYEFDYEGYLMGDYHAEMNPANEMSPTRPANGVASPS
jgi:hypothetical protein